MGSLGKLDHALVVMEKDRPRTVAAWRVELTGHSPTPSPHPVPVSQPSSPNGKRKIFWIVGGLLLLAGGGYFAEQVRETARQEEIRQAREMRRADEARQAKAEAERQAQAKQEADRQGQAKIEFVKIPKGCFQIGMSEEEQRTLKGHEKYDDWFKNAENGHEVCVDAFELGRYEVTVKQFQMFVEATGYRTEAEKGDGCVVLNNGKWKMVAGKNWKTPGFEQGSDHPAVCVSWNDAQEYIRWLNNTATRSRYRLPTEAEWEYAARSGTETMRYWGNGENEACQYANVADRTAKSTWFPVTIFDCSDEYPYTSPAGRFRANRDGLHDMLGNVWEWTCSDWGGYADGGKNHTKCSSGGSSRVERGGGWGYGPAIVRSAHRDSNVPGYRNNYLGFRLARTAP